MLVNLNVYIKKLLFVILYESNTFKLPPLQSCSYVEYSYAWQTPKLNVTSFSKIFVNLNVIDIRAFSTLLL